MRRRERAARLIRKCQASNLSLWMHHKDTTLWYHRVHMKRTTQVRSTSKTSLSKTSNRNITAWRELTLSIVNLKTAKINTIPVSSLLNRVQERMQAANSEKRALKDSNNLQWSIFSHPQVREARALVLGKGPKLKMLEMRISVSSRTKSGNLISSKKLLVPIPQVQQARETDRQARKAGRANWILKIRFNRESWYSSNTCNHTTTVTALAS